MDSQRLAAAAYHHQRRLRIGRALLLALASGGVLVLLTAWRIYRVARLASCRAVGSSLLLVPGYRLDRGEVPAAYASRLRRALHLWQRNPYRLLVLSGIADPPDTASEAHGGLSFLCDLGLPGYASVLLDPLARDTEENLLNAARLLRAEVELDIADGDPHSIGHAGVAVVSNRWHLARCAWLAERHGLQWRICAAETRWRPGLFDWLALIREALSLLSFAGAEAARIDPRRLLRLHR